MKLVYIDTSVLIAVFFQEPNYKNYLKYFSKNYQLISSEILVAEFYSFLSRNKRPLSEAFEILDYLSIVRPDKGLENYCEMILSYGYAKGADLFHIANALYIDPEVKELVFLTHDVKQGKLAKKVGFKVL